MIRVAGRSFETLPHWRRLLDDEFSSHIEITNILIEVPEARRSVGIKSTFGLAVPRIATWLTILRNYRLFVREACIPHRAQVVVWSSGRFGEYYRFQGQGYLGASTSALCDLSINKPGTSIFGVVLYTDSYALSIATIPSCSELNSSNT
jgi:hypothetical protein